MSLLVFLLVACRMEIPPAALPDLPPGTNGGNPTSTYSPALVPPTVTPTLFIPPRPSPAVPTPAFPTCEPDPVEPYRFDPGRVPIQWLLPTPVPTAPTLRSLAVERGLWFGAATAPSMFRRPEYVALLSGQFNMLAAENAMKWEVIRPEPDVYDFSQGDALVDFAKAHGMGVYAHVLVWDLQQPAWLTEGQHSRDEWIQILCRHIKTVVTHYRGHIHAWDVVNEPFTRQGELTNTHWMRMIGPAYIAMAFQWAREADPQALLVLNEFFAEGMNEKSQAVYSLVRSLLRQGTPVDAVGMQMHLQIFGPPTEEALRRNMRRLAELGIEIHITEIDVRLQDWDDTAEKELAAQADVYRMALSVCLEIPTCTVFITWGASDNVSWIPSYTGVPDAPLLFDRNYQPKPAYDALMDVLSQAP